MSILDVSKLTMYKFMYDFLKPINGENCRHVYTDTDSFVLSLKELDFYKVMRENSDMFDTFSYPKPNDFNIEPENNKIPGPFKDELKGQIMTEFVGLRAKCYAINVLNDNRALEELKNKNKKPRKTFKIKKSKGIKMSVVKRKIKFSDYTDCIFKKKIEPFKRKQNIFRSIKHKIYSIQQEKVALNPADDKRYLIKPDCIDTLAWGHKSIAAYEMKQKLISGLVGNENM